MASSAAMRLQERWWSAEAPPRTLRALAALFGALVRTRRAAYAHGLLARRSVGLPVIVVGNLTVGGSGKTPLVIWCCEQLRELGRRPGVVLRGYGGTASRGREPQLVRTSSSAHSVGDEALLLARRTAAPVVVGRDRVRAARRLAQEGVDVVVADDGLQHLALARDLQLAVIDGARGLGNGWLLPAGPLREPVEQLAQMNAIVINGGASEAGVAERAAHGVPCYRMQLQGDRLQRLDSDPSATAALPLQQLAGRRVHAVAGIGNPQRFFALLRAAGLEPIEHAFPDHHAYRPQELRFGDDLPVLMTEKDAVKCRSLGVRNGWWLAVTARFAPAQATALRALLGRAIERAASAGRPVR